MFALIDCNNFYASCERLFRPDLHHKPIVILSNNDGCVIARSNEAKAVGIAMGEPFFKVKGLCQQAKVHVFSSNYTLYGDLSQRVMSVIDAAWPHVEIYSIDEAFLDLSSMPIDRHDSFCSELQQRILKHTGIPTSVGIGQSKTLAKLANCIAKKTLKIPVMNVSEQRDWLHKVDVGEVWGVGRSWHKKLVQQGIYTAGDLASTNLQVLKERYNVTLMRTAMELSGIPCTGLDISEPSQSIISSRSFGGLQTQHLYLAQAISSHCAIAWQKMRAQQLMTQRISVFVQSNRFRDDLPQYNNTINFKLTQATDDLRYLTQCAKFCLKKIFKSGIHYQKVGIMFSHLIDKQHRQLDLFTHFSDERSEHAEQIMSIFDAVNSKFGRHTLYLAAEGTTTPWAMKRQMKSPCYTTTWAELPTVSAN